MGLTVLLSPAKKLNFDCITPALEYKQPVLWEKTKQLSKTLKALSAEELGKLMKLSFELSKLNHDRYQHFQTDQTKKDSKPALLVFNGEVYNGIDAQSFNTEDLKYANKYIRILSGLYGILKPLDFIQPYRLEMGTKLAIGKHKNLYDFWGEDIADIINKDNSSKQTIINLASNEYFKATKHKLLQANIITPLFKDFKNGQYKTVMVYAKKARGQMTNFIVKNRISDPEQLKSYDVDRYTYNTELSTKNEWVFTR